MMARRAAIPVRLLGIAARIARIALEAHAVDVFECEFHAVFDAEGRVPL